MIKKDYVLMTVFAIISSVLYFTRLGSFTAPQTYWQPAQTGEYVTFALGRQVNLDKLMIFGGVNDWKYGDSNRFEIGYEQQDGSFFYISDFEVDQSKVLRWNPVNLNVKTSEVRIFTRAQGGTINEIAFYEAGSDIPLRSIRIIDIKVTPGDRGDAANLIDEQNTIPQKYTYQTGSYFDETFHVRTAYEYLHGMTPYESTHPPLGKDIIAFGIVLFGAVPFGWRCFGALFGVLNVLVMYRFGKRIFKKSIYAAICAFLMMLDFMNFTQSRVGLIDSFAVFFIIMMYYYMYDYFTDISYRYGQRKSLKPLFLCGLFFGLGAAVKWITLFGAPGLAVLFFWAKYNEYRETRKVTIPIKTLLCCVLFFTIIPLFIYIISYIPFVAANDIKINVYNIPGGFGNIIQSQGHMFTYHETMTRSNPFASAWYEWPFIITPYWYFKGVDVGPGMVSTIVAMGNPAIWWVGIPAFFLALYISVKKKLRYMAVIFVAAAFQYLVWAFIPRITFIYHYYSTIPFVIFAIVFVIRYFTEPDTMYETESEYIAKPQRRRKAIIITVAYLIIVICLFIWFYPVISGLEVSKTWIDSARWFSSWVFYPTL